MFEQFIPAFVLNNIEFFIFVILLTAFLVYKRENLEVQGNFPFLYMLLYKTTWGIDLMKKWSKNQPRLWKGVAYCSIVLGIVGTILMIPFMIWQLFFIVDNNLESGGGLVLPIDDGSAGGLIFYVPFWYWIVVILFVAIVHEFGHGVIAKLYKVKVKSSGFAFAGLVLPILPAAFVEPDMKDLQTKERWKQIAVLGAGPFANVFFSIIFLLMILGLGAYSQDFYEERGVYYDGLNESSTLNNYVHSEINVSSGIISKLEFEGYVAETPQEIYNFFQQNLSENQEILLTIYDTNFTKSHVVSMSPYLDSKGDPRIGIYGVRAEIVPKEGFENQAENVNIASEWLFWFFLLNFGIGIMNLLPLWITDGGQITRVLLSRITSERNAILGVHIASFISLILIIFTIFPSMIPFS